MVRTADSQIMKGCHIRQFSGPLLRAEGGRKKGGVGPSGSSRETESRCSTAKGRGSQHPDNNLGFDLKSQGRGEGGGLRIVKATVSTKRAPCPFNGSTDTKD